MKPGGCRINWTAVLTGATITLLLLLSWNFYITPDKAEETKNEEIFQNTNPQNDARNAMAAPAEPQYDRVPKPPSKPLVQKCQSSTQSNAAAEMVVRMYDENSWTYDKNICSGLESRKGNNDFKKTNFKSIVGDMPIYIHDPLNDGISNAVLRTHNFEPHVFRTLFPLLKLDPELSLIDIGANIGVNSLQAAKYGRYSIAIEATTESTQHICASAQDGSVLDKITIIHNAISNDHTPVKIVHAKKGGFGGAFMDDNSDLHKLKVAWDGNVFNFSQSTILKTVTLDDILDLPNVCSFKKVLIKIDVEGSEHKAFQGAMKFFEQADVQGVLMEYRWHVTRPTKNIILDFFEKFKFDPFDFKSGYLRKLEARTMKNHDVLWLPSYRTASMDNMKIW